MAEDLRARALTTSPVIRCWRRCVTRTYGEPSGLAPVYAETMSPASRPSSRSLVPAVVAFLAILPACRCDVRSGGDGVSAGAPVTSSPGAGAMAVTGPEVWTIDGKPFQIRATYFLVLNGRLQFTVDYLCAERCPVSVITMEAYLIHQVEAG